MTEAFNSIATAKHAERRMILKLFDDRAEDPALSAKLREFNRSQAESYREYIRKTERPPAQPPAAFLAFYEHE